MEANKSSILLARHFIFPGTSQTSCNNTWQKIKAVTSKNVDYFMNDNVDYYPEEQACVAESLGIIKINNLNN